MAQERAAGGEFRSSVSDSAILDFLSESTRPFSTTRDVADHFGMERSAAFRRLQQLAADERLSTDKAGSARVWWVDR